MTLDQAKTPEDWIAAVHALPIDELGAKIDAATRKATGLPLIASLALLALDTLGDAGVSALHKQSGHLVSPSTMDALVIRGYARPIDGPRRSWRITMAGKIRSELIRNDVTALMKRLTARRPA